METLREANDAGAEYLRLTFAYDSQGRRYRKTVLVLGQGAPIVRVDSLFIYDGWNLVATLRSQVSGLRSQQFYVWGLDLSGTMQGAGGVGGLLAVTDESGSTFYPEFDGNGNVMGYYAADTGARVAEFEYGPFGESIRATGSKVGEFNFRFSTKYLDQEILMYYYGFRYYDPVTGRWPSRDPIGEVGGLSIYAMVRNSPVNYLDVLGLSCRNVDPCSQGEVDRAVQDLLDLLNSSEPDEAAIREAAQDILDFAEQQQIIAEGWPGQTFNLGIGGNAALFLGAEGSLDISFSVGDQFEDFDFGISGSLAGQLGINLGADAHVSTISGSVQDQEGGYASLFGNLGPVSVTLIDNDVTFDPLPNINPNGGTNPFDGAQIGLGLGWPVGFGNSFGQTDVISFQGVIDAIGDCFD